MKVEIEDDEGILEGEVNQEGERNGRGSYLWFNGNFYNGQWAHNHPEGTGALYYSDGGIVKGSFLLGKLNGYGISLYANGDKYQGNWENGSFHGRGVFYLQRQNQWQLSIFHQGSCKHLLKTGFGRPISICNVKTSPFILIGFDARDNSKQEQNTYVKDDNEESFYGRYEGDLVNGMRDGNGILYMSDGTYFDGNWKNNLPNGLGLFHHPDGKNDVGIYEVNQNQFIT